MPTTGDGAFAAASAAVCPPDPAAAAEGTARSDRLTKPPGSLGRLEALGAQLSGIAGVCPPPLPEPAAAAVFAADHGVVAEGVTPWPSEVTAQMVANFSAGGAAINVLARQHGVRLLVVDVGVAGPLPVTPSPADPVLVEARVRPGTGNIAVEPAMTAGEATAALDLGAATARRLVDEGAACLITGEMGIGNTTPSAALIAVLCGRPPAEVTGTGSGIDSDMLRHKIAVVERAVGRLADAGTATATATAAATAKATATGTGTGAGPASGVPTDPRSVLADIGGLEIAALAGFITGGAAARVPVIVDGLIAAAAAVVAHAITPAVAGYLIAGHRSTEPGSAAAFAHLGLEPLFDLRLRLGEGTGACLAFPLVSSAARILREMATFDSAGVTGKEGR